MNRFEGWEPAQLAEQAKSWLAQGIHPVLATVVRVQGSAYRGEGAQLLIGADGAWVGNISGGCLEPDVALAAPGALAAAEGRLLHYDLTGDDLFGLGLGCGGEVDVWLEPLPAAWLEAALAPGGGAWVRVVGRPGAGRWFPVQGTATGSLGSAALDAAAFDLATRALQEERPQGRDVAGVRLFADVMLPPPALVLCGGGADAPPIVQMGVLAGLDVHVIEARPAYAAAPGLAGAHVLQRDPAAGLLALQDAQILNQRSFVVVMNHHRERDLASLKTALRSPARAIGVMGPRARTEEMLAELGVTGDDRIHAPVGLDLGAETPAEVALSIVAGCVALRRDGTAGFLHRRSGPIHVRRVGERA